MCPNGDTLVSIPTTLKLQVVSLFIVNNTVTVNNTETFYCFTKMCMKFCTPTPYLQQCLKFHR